MIIPDAKCVVNGAKVNEVINVLNNLLNVAVSEEFDVVEYGNVPGRRWFFTGKLTGQKQDSASPGRDKLNDGSGSGSNNRDNMPKFDGGGGALKDDGGVNPPVRDNMPKFNGGGGGQVDQFGNTIGGTGGAMLARDAGQVDQFGNTIGGTGGAMLARDAGQAARDFDDTMGGTSGAFGGGVDQFGNELNADGTRVTPGGMPKDTGDAGQAAQDFDDTPKVGAPPLSGDSGRETRTLGDWIRGNQPKRRSSTGGGGEGSTIDGTSALPPAWSEDQPTGAGAGPGGLALPKTESEYRDLVDRVRTGRASQEDRDIFQSILDTMAQNREAKASQDTMRDPLEAQMHAERQAAANRVAEENRMVWTYGQTGSKNTGANWLTKYTDNGGIYQR